MRKIASTQKDVRFAWCSSPIAIDKRGEWGNKHENFQEGPKGAFLKFSSETEISHLVQPNSDKTAPEGWTASDKPGLFDKSPIWVEEEILETGTTKTVVSLDNPNGMVYKITEPSVVCYNDRNGEPNKKDAWVQKLSIIKKNYVY